MAGLLCCHTPGNIKAELNHSVPATRDASSLLQWCETGFFAWVGREVWIRVTFRPTVTASKPCHPPVQHVWLLQSSVWPWQHIPGDCLTVIFGHYGIHISPVSSWFGGRKTPLRSVAVRLPLICLLYSCVSWQNLFFPVC